MSTEALNAFVYMKVVSTMIGTAFFAAFAALALLLLGSLIPIAGGYQIRIVESGSMAPTIPMGSALVLRAADAYEVGDIVTFQRIDDEEVTTHRIIEEEIVSGEVIYTMQGDANNVADQRTVKEREIVGKVRAHIPFLGFVLDFVRQPLGFILIIGLPALWIVYEQVLRIVRELKKQKDSPKEEESGI